ncbi:hypothetical protein ACJX0J_018328 [Zea mays]
MQQQQQQCLLAKKIISETCPKKYSYEVFKQLYGREVTDLINSTVRGENNKNNNIPKGYVVGNFCFYLPHMLGGQISSAQKDMDSQLAINQYKLCYNKNDCASNIKEWFTIKIYFIHIYYVLCIIGEHIFVVINLDTFSIHLREVTRSYFTNKL